MMKMMWPLSITLMMGAALTMPIRAEATVLSKVRLRGAAITDTTVGGTGELEAVHSDSGTFTDAFHTLTTSGSLTSRASEGRLTGAILSEIEIPGSNTRTSGFVEMFVDQVDTYTVGAGSSGLPNGAPVQIVIESTLEGQIHIEGRPSGGSTISFNVQGVPGIVGRWIDWGTGGLSPPQDIPFEEEWRIVVDTTVGASFTLTSNLDSTLNGTAFDGPTTGQNWANGSATIRVSPGPSYGGVVVESEAGAPTQPLPQVPLSSPVSIVLLVATLMAAGVIRAAGQSRDSMA